MEIRLVTVPAKAEIREQGLHDLLKNASAAIVILLSEASARLRATLASAVAGSEVAFFAAWGPEAEVLHDEVDSASLKVRTTGPITVWETTSTLNEFLWNVLYTYRGLLSTSDQEAPLLLINIALDDTLPSEFDLFDDSSHPLRILMPDGLLAE